MKKLGRSPTKDLAQMRETFFRACSFGLLLAALGIPAALDAGQSDKSLPRYGDTFPLGRLDYFGLSTIEDYTVPSDDKACLGAVVKRDFDKAMKLAEGRITKDPDDFTAYVLFVQASDLAGKMDHAVDALQLLRYKSAKFDPKSETWTVAKPNKSHQIAEVYARIVGATRKTYRTIQGAPELGQTISASAATSRLEAMVVLSILWWQGDLKAARTYAEACLAKDPGFFQLRTFYAYLWSHGVGPRRYGNGTIDYSTAAGMDVAQVMKQANMVIKSHPDFTPVYFVARFSSDKAEVKRNLQRFLQGCNPASDWYRRAKAFVDGH